MDIAGPESMSLPIKDLSYFERPIFYRVRTKKIISMTTGSEKKIRHLIRHRTRNFGQKDLLRPHMIEVLVDY